MKNNNFENKSKYMNKKIQSFLLEAKFSFETWKIWFLYLFINQGLSLKVVTLSSEEEEEEERKQWQAKKQDWC